jgi:hypothetical protein
MNFQTVSAVAAILSAGPAVGGCAGSTVPAGFKALERTATAADTLPPEVDLGDIELGKVLLVAERNGKKYFVGQASKGAHGCLITVPADGRWYSGCSDATEGHLLTSSGPDQQPAMLVSDGFDTRDLESLGWTKIADNVLVAGT